MSSLRLDWCTHEAAKYAVERWHYSRSYPAGKTIRIGVWESDLFIGAVVFSRGASDSIGKPYGLPQTAVAELTRIALTSHDSPVSKILSVAIRMLRQQSPGLRLLVSYADPAQNHHGGVYQAAGWIYTGKTQADFALIDSSGKRWHSRMVSTSGIKRCFGKTITVIRPDQGQKVAIPGKHKYLLPLDQNIRSQIHYLSQPYPKRVGSETIDTAAIHVAEGGETPTPTLQSPTHHEPPTAESAYAVNSTPQSQPLKSVVVPKKSTKKRRKKS